MSDVLNIVKCKLCGKPTTKTNFDTYCDAYVCADCAKKPHITKMPNELNKIESNETGINHFQHYLSDEDFKTMNIDINNSYGSIFTTYVKQRDEIYKQVIVDTLNRTEEWFEIDVPTFTKYITDLDAAYKRGYYDAMNNVILLNSN